jgi:hypothetical protein
MQERGRALVGPFDCIQWVKNEAAAAAERGVLLFDRRVTVPLEFRRTNSRSHRLMAIQRIGSRRSAGRVGYDWRGCTKSADDRTKVGLALESALDISCGCHNFARAGGRILRRSRA